MRKQLQEIFGWEVLQNSARSVCCRTAISEESLLCIISAATLELLDNGGTSRTCKEPQGWRTRRTIQWTQPSAASEYLQEQGMEMDEDPLETYLLQQWEGYIEVARIIHKHTDNVCSIPVRSQSPHVVAIPRSTIWQATIQVFLSTCLNKNISPFWKISGHIVVSRCSSFTFYWLCACNRQCLRSNTPESCVATRELSSYLCIQKSSYPCLSLPKSRCPKQPVFGLLLQSDGCFCSRQCVSWQWQIWFVYSAGCRCAAGCYLTLSITLWATPIKKPFSVCFAVKSCSMILWLSWAFDTTAAPQ